MKIDFVINNQMKKKSLSQFETKSLNYNSFVIKAINKMYPM